MRGITLGKHSLPAQDGVKREFMGCVFAFVYALVLFPGPVITRCFVGHSAQTQCVCQTKDKTHAARRLLSRPWACDEQIDEIVKTIVTGSQSITQRLRHSPDLSAIFSACVQDMTDDAPLTGNLSNALHRFDSVLRPMSREVLQFDALVAAVAPEGPS